ncbi:hypothetical protein [Alkalihalophilus marmarensis]|uniref:hypothetical protein n=1 Tax=Alkalihalophilus marmarensis TaxID=521377 RepID=UPI002E1B1766|nr:hypothetical protein [Alkalihalophilus marmarensis]
MKKFTSRKFWMAVVSAAVILGNEGLGLELPTESIMTVAAVAISYILGESYVDSQKSDNKN